MNGCDAFEPANAVSFMHSVEQDGVPRPPLATKMIRFRSQLTVCHRSYCTHLYMIQCSTSVLLTEEYAGPVCLGTNGIPYPGMAKSMSVSGTAMSSRWFFVNKPVSCTMTSGSVTFPTITAPGRRTRTYSNARSS